MSYISLHNHSVFSFYAGVPTVPELVAKAKACGMTALGLTDIDRMSGLILFYLECRKAGIRPILGVELTRRSTWRSTKNSTCQGGRSGTGAGWPSAESVVLLARNARGYGDLCEIVTKRKTDETFSFETVFGRPWEDLLFMTRSCDVLRLLANGPNRPRLYGEIVNHDAASRQRGRAVDACAQDLGVPLVAGNDVYFIDKCDWETHRVLRAIGLCATVSRLRGDEYAPPQAHFRSGDEMARLFPRHPAAILETRRIADDCAVELDLNRWIMPAIEVPGGETPEACLRRLAWQGFDANYGKRPEPERARARAVQEKELGVIESLGYASYFLVVKDIRDWADRTFSRGYRRPGDSTILRGSAANAITFYNLGVSGLDPIRYDLYFERFLNEDRASPPDADLDFGWDERGRALDYMVKRWGRDRVAITCTTNHFRGRAAFREVAKVSGYSDEQITEVMKSRRTRNRQIDDDELRAIAALSEKIRGKPRFLGQHPGGVLVTNGPVWRHTACEYASLGASSGASIGGVDDEQNECREPRLITQIDMHNGIDELGLIKFDLLGNGSLSVLRDALCQIESQGLPDPGVWDGARCQNDGAVREMIAQGRTRGIFYIESPAQMRLNMKAQASTFEEVTVTSSLVRPAGAKYTAVYVERHRKAKRGVKDWEFVHPSLEPILRDTHDVCAFQEDVTKICHQVAGLSFKRADKIRKMMNSLHEGACTREELAGLAREFMEGCRVTRGLSPGQAFELWQRVASFSGFSFCKSHSASYATLSFKCAYLKAHYPAQFFAAVLSNEHGFYGRSVYVDEARRWGIRILPLSVNESDVGYAGKHRWLRPGLMHVRGVRRGALHALVAERTANGRFRNLPDCIGRTALFRGELENLVLAGAFDGFGLTRPELLYQLDGSVVAAGGAPERAPRLDLDVQECDRGRLHPGLSDYTLAERCLNELRLLGFMVSGDILDILDLHPSACGSVPASAIGARAGREIKAFGWPIAKRVHHAGDGQRLMMFLTLEDRTGCVDVIVWPDAYERFYDDLQESGPFEVRGVVKEEYGTFSLVAKEIRAVAWSPSIIDLRRASERLANSFADMKNDPDVVEKAA